MTEMEMFVLEAGDPMIQEIKMTANLACGSGVQSVIELLSGGYSADMRATLGQIWALHQSPYDADQQQTNETYLRLATDFLTARAQATGRTHLVKGYPRALGAILDNMRAVGDRPELQIP